jgi:predicted enzyme related to lactoylglutathione lyase
LENTAMSTQKTTHAPGTFCWPELTSTDQRAAEKFYTSLFGWSTKETPMGPDSHYTIFTKDGEAVSAAAQMDANLKGVPSNWLSYVAVTSVDQSLEKAKTLGATVVAGPFDVMEHGRMAVLKDPQGAHFALWQANQMPGIGRLNEDDSLAWTELMTTDTRKAAEFYSGLFGWGTEKFPGGTMDYTLWKNGSQNAGGMMAITPEMGAIPPNWLVYFGVKDADATTAKAKQLGGSAMREPWTTPGVGRIAILTDPTGAAFAIIKGDPEQK